MSNPSLLLPYEQYYIQSLHQERKLIPEQSPGETKPCSKRSLAPNPHIPHEQVSSASACIWIPHHHSHTGIRIPHHHSHTAMEHQHTSNQVCGSAGTIFRRHYHNMLHRTLITIRHHGSQYLPNTLSNTATHIKTNNALINSTLTQYLYISYRYNP